MATPQEKTEVATELVRNLKIVRSTSGMMFIDREHIQIGVDNIASCLGIPLTTEEKTEIADRAEKEIMVLELHSSDRG